MLDRRLEGRTWRAGDVYSIADIACYPWIVPHAGHGQDLGAFPHIERWFESIAARAATQRVYRGVEDVYAKAPDLSPSARKALFEQAIPEVLS